ncbi:hypothetical protein EPA93_03920 [Ktedonosporobacter rubrisoli]|uniref:Uncharacterized protein n=1 Tax=Ktedonosporobacter rubrisoli TaxID=2509675 RepID=A0A4P6JJ99_KTERU|nr:hypothetical protein [Ktedonosporobacter rubrisoli]QBD75184.1 hypothetical protein EPA93_03920 [Ktedonosporobacter rubrisoli]
MDEWDSISSDTPPNSATDDAWDAVSTPGRPSSQRRQLPPDNLIIEDSLQPARLPGPIMPVTASSQEPPIAPAMPSPVHAKGCAVSSSASAATLPPAPPLRYKQIVRDILALLSAVLFWGSVAPYFWHHIYYISFLMPFYTPLLCLLSYAIGMCIAAISGRKGFDALSPVLLGCLAGFVIRVVIFLTWIDFYVLTFDVYIFLFPLLGAATYAAIQKIRGRSSQASGRQRPLPAPQSSVWQKTALCFAGLLLAASGFSAFHVVNVHNASVAATATAEVVATATATTAQQMYIQDTSGIPAIEDPLSDNNKGYAWGVLTFNFGGSCWFTGKDYHLAITNSANYWMWCAGRGIALNNFAFQVQERMLKPGDAGIVFGYTANGFYRMDVGSEGTFTLYQYTENNKQTQVVQSGTSSAIKSGLNQANIMTLDVHNGNLYFYVNSQFVMNEDLSANGLPYKPGTFGFAAENFGQPTEVVYTNLKVWML